MPQAIYKVCLNNDFATLGPLAHHINKKFPEIKNITRVDTDFGGGNRVFISDKSGKIPKIIEVKDITFADSSFFSIFSFKAIYGNLETALKNPYTIVLTKTTSNKLFGNINPVGKSIGYICFDGRFDLDFTITAVIEDMPEKRD